MADTVLEANPPMIQAKPEPSQPFISNVNSRSLQALGVECRKVRAEIEQAKAELQALNDVKARLLSEDSLNGRIERISRQIERVNQALDTADNAKDMQAQSTALKNLYQLWSLLTGHGPPAATKAKTNSKSRPTYGPLPEPEPDLPHT